ncbi:conserved hypothetical protein [Theileria orientalis strain Shintoku]|uniref:Uncharacterized protein n=1 Tax=Theileria orientalis strain Shintoku TaxID=869250 RepID=J4C8E2_THEOR|nr:conserved hypothetical protein [Theileria orientalis strain Shintoku]BAM40633.1 conserved hypothetical protein [Theileria orientalis strain Shintoku]|eukprot:XP_009690934.1 conserved hypothetical protein [Theileria orientalis strain Shintoku]
MDAPVEFAKLEDVQGLKFQHALVVPSSSYEHGGLEGTLSSLVVGKYNVLIQYGGPVAKFYHLQRVIDEKGVSEGNLLMTLDVGARIVSMASGSATSRADNNYGNNGNMNRNRGGSVDKEDNRMWYRVTSENETLMLFVVDAAGTMALINVGTGEAMFETKLIGQGPHHNGIGVSHGSQDRVRLVGNVDNKRVLIVTRSDKMYLVDLSADGSNGADRNRVSQLTIKNARDGSDDTLSETLNGDYDVVGCHIVNDRVLLGIIVPFYDDNLVLICSLGVERSGSRELVPLGYCYNEFFFTSAEDDRFDGESGEEEILIAFKHVEKWDLFIAYSNRSTTTVLITSNSRLREGATTADTAGEGGSGPEYNALLMAEGYALGSNEFENHVLDLFVYANYKNEIYRNDSLEDTPTLKDPVVVGLATNSGEVLMFYVDRHVLGADNKEEEILCGLYNKERDVSISRSGSSTSSGGDSDVAKGDVQKFLAQYYKEGFLEYREDKRQFKLHEALCNSLEYFNASLEQVLDAEYDAGDGSPIRVSNSIKGGYNVDCKLDKLKDYNLIIKKLLNIQQDLANALYKISAPGSPVDANEGGTSGSETPLPRTADLNGNANDKDSGKELMDKMYNLLDNLELQSMESVSAENLKEVESSLTYINASLNSLYRRFDGLENKLLDVHNQMVFNEIGGGDASKTLLPKYREQLPEPSPTDSPAKAVVGGVSSAGRSSSSLVERKLDRLVDDIVRLYNRPLLDLTSELGNLRLRSGALGAQGGALGEGPSGLRGGAKLKYNNYDVLFKGSGGTVNLPSGSAAEQSAPRSLFPGSRVAPSESDRSATLTSGGQGKEKALGRGKVAGTSSATTATGAFASGPSKTFSAPTAAGSHTNTGVGAGVGIGTGVDKGDGGKTTVPSIFGTSVLDSSLTGASAIPGCSASAAVGASAPGGAGGEAGKVKFGQTASLLSGYNLVPSSLETPNAGGAASGGIGGSANAGSEPSGTSAFAGFNTNKSLLDIALNSSQGACTAANTLGGAFPATAGFSATGATGTTGALGATGVVGGFVGAGVSAGALGSSFFNSSGNAGTGAGSLGPSSSLLAPGSPSAFRSGTSSPFGGNDGSSGWFSSLSGSVSRGSFTGAGNFAANSFTASSSLFGSSPTSDNSSLFSQGAGSAGTVSSSSIFGSSSGNLFGGPAYSSGLSIFSTSAGSVSASSTSNSTVGGRSVFGTGPPAGTSAPNPVGASLSGDLWGTSRRSNPLD